MLVIKTIRENYGNDEQFTLELLRLYGNGVSDESLFARILI